MVDMRLINGRGRGVIIMKDFSTVLTIICVFMAFLAALIVIVIVNPNKINVNAKRENDDIIEEVKISLENETKRRS